MLQLNDYTVFMSQCHVTYHVINHVTTNNSPASPVSMSPDLVVLGSGADMKARRFFFFHLGAGYVYSWPHN